MNPEILPGADYEAWTWEAAVHPSVVARFEQMVQRHPDRLAVKDGELSLTYAELNRQANRLAWALLARRGPWPEPVALLLEHGAATITAILGVLKAGKFYLPLDPAYPKARLEAVLADSGAALLVYDPPNSALAAALPVNGRLPLVDGLPDGTLGPPEAWQDQNPRQAIQPEAYFNLLYTSGSTGQPKGVLQNHAMALNDASLCTRLFKLTCHDRFALVVPVTYGASVSDILQGLLNGAAVYPYDLKKAGLAGLAAWMQAEGITVYHSTPTVYRHFLSLAGPEVKLPAMRLIKLGGELALKRDVDLLRRHFGPACLLRNGLGSTETFLATCLLVDGTYQPAGAVIPIGYPLDTKEILLLDDLGRPVLPGEVGRIAIRSRYLSPGYWRRPDLNAAVFAPDPHDANGRLYLTEDLGRLLPDGCLEWVARRDGMVKIRGQRVEPAEVEMALVEQPGVRDAAVEVRPGPDGELRLVAYLLAQGPERPAGSSLRQALAEKLPESEIPSAFVWLREFPLLSFGKVNRPALPQPDWAHPDGEAQDPSAGEPPRPGLEASLAAVWQEVLGLEPGTVFSREASFFELGGDSLRMGQVLAHSRERLGIDLPPTCIYEHPTVASLAAWIEGKGKPGESALPEDPLDEATDLAVALRRLGSV